MRIQQLLQKLLEEIHGKNRKEIIETYEEQLSKEMKELSKNENFFKLPLNNIFFIISKFDFNFIEESDKIIEIIKILI